MKYVALFFFFFSAQALALEAVVTVLEAPMLKDKRYDAPVVQYLRKGQVIRLHSALGNDTQYDHLAPSPEKYKQLRKKLEELPEWQDPLFKEGKDRVVELHDEFIPVVDRLGNIAYVLSDHIYVYFNDSRELSQRVAKKDPTDYRLEEPLPKNYPLYIPTGQRGQMLLGFSQPYNESYDYPDSVKTKSYMTPVELYMNLLWRAQQDKTDRFYYGANWFVKTFENSYTFFDKRTSKERYLQLGIGPIISYDAYKGEKNRLNVSFSINFHPLNYVNVTQELNDLKESRVYRGFNFSFRVGAQYHRKEVSENLDFVLGTTIHFESPGSMQAQSGASRSDWWRNVGGENYKTRAFFTFTGFLGLQGAY